MPDPDPSTGRGSPRAESSADWQPLVRSRLGAGGVAPRQELIDVIDEVAGHLDELYRSMRAAGKSDEEAMAAVEAELVHLVALARDREVPRVDRLAGNGPAAAGPSHLLCGAWRDLRHGVRVLGARPGFTAAAMLTLALGIGANTAIFSVVHSLLLAPLAFPEPERLVAIWETALDDRNDINIVSAPNWKDWRSLSTSFEEVGIWEALTYNISGGDEPEQVRGMRVSAGTFRMLGIPAQLGRTFTDAEDESGSRVVVISHALWRRRFAAHPGTIGRELRVNGEAHEVIGVMPPHFRFPNRLFEVWVPIAFNDTDAERDSHSFLAAGRLKPGVSFETAREEVEALGRRIDSVREGHGATITPLSDEGVAQLRPTLQALFGAVGLVLLIACVNVANLLLAQTAARRREFVVRSALGASRARLGRQLLAEGLLLAGGGAALGVFVASAATAALAQSLPPSIALAPFRVSTIGLNVAVLSFTAAIGVAAGVLFSLAPIFGLGRTNVSELLKSGGRAGTSRSAFARAALVGAEIALALIVLAGAGLMIKSVMRLTGVAPGLDPRNVLVLSVALPQPDFYGPPVRTSFCADLQREVASLPGVRSVGAMSQMPLEGAGASRGFEIDGRAAPGPDDQPQARYRLVCPGYFGTLSIPLTRGRDFTHTDTVTSPPVVIVSESTARLYWPDRDPIGARMRIGQNPWMTVVGVVADVRQIRLDANAPRVIYRPYSQAAWPALSVTVKTAVEPLALTLPVQRALRRVDPEMPVSRVRTMEGILQASIGDRRFPMQLLGLFSIVALALAAIGVYGVVSYMTSQRTREIGIRVALGAQAPQLTREIVARSLLPIGAGIAAGITGARFTSTLLQGLLYGVQPSDPIVLGSIAIVLGGAALVASWIPARRAAGVDPIAVLRQE
jgi:putative ABC transport system permease protein